jgi:hypothetical protein
MGITGTPASRTGESVSRALDERPASQIRNTGLLFAFTICG